MVERIPGDLLIYVGIMPTAALVRCILRYEELADSDAQWVDCVEPTCTLYATPHGEWNYGEDGECYTMNFGGRWQIWTVAENRVKDGN